MRGNEVDPRLVSHILHTAERSIPLFYTKCLGSEAIGEIKTPRIFSEVDNILWGEWDRSMDSIVCWVHAYFRARYSW